MPNLQLNQHNSLIELFEVEHSPGQHIRWCNSVLKWAEKVGDTVVLHEPAVTYDGKVFPGRACNSEGWSQNPDGEDRPMITVHDQGAAIYNALDLSENAILAPIRRIQILAADLVSGDPGAVISTEEWMINSFGFTQGTILTLELTDDIMGPRTEFPSRPMTEEDYPGMLQDYDA